MNCDLARTGSDFGWAAMLFAGLSLILIGIVLQRAHRSARVLTVLLLVAGAGALAASSAQPAHAACAPNSLTIVQTSMNTGLAPTQLPSLIVGRVTNNGGEEALITAIVVSIGSVQRAPGAVPGACDAGDYVIHDPRMPVGEHLAASGGWAVFSGARIGFLDAAVNQDACKGATVTMHYTTE